MQRTYRKFASLRSFAAVHDDLPAFHAAYLVLTFLIAAMFSMGVFGMLILAHMTLDLVKYREVQRYGWGKTMLAASRESLVDITLLFLGLTFSIYLHHSLPAIASLSGLARAEVTILRGGVLIGTKLKILWDVLAVFRRMQEYLLDRRSPLSQPMSLLDWTALGSLCTCALLLPLATVFLPLSGEEVLSILLRELLPWRV